MTSLSILAALVPLSGEHAESGPGVTPFLVGGLALCILLFLMFCMLAFGKGREHS